jgi:hypothetical protein
LIRADKWSFQVYAQNSGLVRLLAAHRPRNGSQGVLDLFHGSRHRGREESCRAARGVCAGHGVNGIATLHDIGTPTAVAMQINKARNEIGVLRAADRHRLNRRHGPCLP